MNLLPMAAAVFLGACLGSFANVLIHRLPLGQGVARGRSHCPRCEKMIAWYDNIPVLSWLALRGRCRHCHEPIAWRYPVVELVGAALAAACLYLAGITATAASAFVFVYLLGAIAVIDWEHMIIPHTLSITGMVAGLALSEFTGLGLSQSILGLLVGGGSVWALSEGYRLLKGQPGMGFGDVMLMGMVGTFLGPWPAAAVLGAGAFLGTLYVVIRSGGRPDGTAKLPFGTFLAAAAAVVLVVGGDIWNWYLGLLS